MKLVFAFCFICLFLCFNFVFLFFNSLFFSAELFSSCSLFLRQSGLNEQFFALLILALELNVCENKFTEIKLNNCENTLIEYEEIVLKSGLPMNEIWLRIEKLRQNFYFLPSTTDQSSDPQRIVLNEDIYHYIYPLSNRENALNLVIVIMRLLKIPLIDSCRLRSSVFSSYDANKSDNYCDFDSIEEITSIFLHRTIINSNKIFHDIIWSMVRDFSIGPSFITTHIGHEMYIKYLSEILLTCAECFSNENEILSKRNIFITLLIRLERVVMAFNMYMNKWNDDKEKRLRSKIKNLLKREKNRNCLIFYVEYAQIEYDLKRIESSENIFIAAISQCNPLTDDDCTRSEYWYACISYVEMLMCEQQFDKALQILGKLALEKRLDGIDDENNSSCTEASNLLASKKLNDRMKNICSIERNVTIMDIIQCFQPDYLFCVIKANIYHMLLWQKTKEDAIKQLDTLVNSFPEKNPRHEFIRENLYELYVNILLFKMNSMYSSQTAKFENKLLAILKKAIDEFPTNMYLLQCAALCDSQPWYRIRSLLSKHDSPIAITFLIAAAQFRYKKYSTSMLESNETKYSMDLSYINVLSSDIKDIENAYKTRVTNLLRSVTDHEAPTRKCSLLWRLYLRSLLDIPDNLEKCRNILLTALNECPWNKV